MSKNPEKFANMILHSGDKQPKKTKGKQVFFRIVNTDLYQQFSADYLNWNTTNENAPKSGLIAEYKIIE